MAHRDIKPGNILLDKEGNLKITDFGLSKLLEDGDFAQEASGTPQYLAPETLKKSYDKRVDYWALGVILYQMLTGMFIFTIERGTKRSEAMSALYKRM